jgi:hypothetical protein
MFSSYGVAIENKTIFGDYCGTIQNKFIVFIGYDMTIKNKIISSGYCQAAENKFIIFGGYGSFAI